MSLVETLVSLLILSVVATGFASLFGFMASENRFVTDKLEAADLQREFTNLLTDDVLCSCQLTGSPGLSADSASPTGTPGGQIVELPKILYACDDPTRAFAEPGVSVSKYSPSFKVDRIAVRDLHPTGRKDPTTAAYDEYTGAIFIEFAAGTVGPSRTPRSFKTSKIFTTTPDGTKLKSCVAGTIMRESAPASNSPLATTFLPAIAECPEGYSVISGAYRASGADPTCPTTGSDQSPVILESGPVMTVNNLQGWKVVAACQSYTAYATCRRGHQ